MQFRIKKIFICFYGFLPGRFSIFWTGRCDTFDYKILLYSSRWFIEILGAKVSSGSEEKAQLLFDGVVQCYPNEDLYFSTETESIPRIEIDLTEPRIVLGVTIYFRDDISKPHVNRKWFFLEICIYDT